jgi:septum formation protein
MGLEFIVVASNAPELEHEQLTGAETAQVNAYRKARYVAKQHPDALVIGADTVVCADLTIFGKPADQDHAVDMLLQLQGRLHQVITAVCLLHLRAHEQDLFCEVTDVQFRPLTRDQASDYVSKINPLDKAGAYGIQDHGDMVVESIKGSRANVVGLPVEALRQHLERWPGSLRVK